MSSDQDARLQPPVDQVPPPPPGARYPVGRRPRMPWLIAGLVALLLVAGTVTTLLVRANRHSTAKPSTTPSSSPSVSTTAPSASASASATTSAASPSASPSQAPVPPPLLGRGKEAPVSAIPWSQVNGGWQLANWSSLANPNEPPGAPTVLYLVNPIGGRYRIATLPANTGLMLWSPDLRRAMVKSYNDTSATLREYDLSTGRQLSSFVPGKRGLLSYAGPGGHSLLLSESGADGLTSRLELVSTTGVHQAYLPGRTPQVGSFDRPALNLPGGSRFLISGGHGFAVINTSGAIVRQIAAPAGTGYCGLQQWWTTRTAIASCTSPAGSSVQNLYTIPTDGRTPVKLTNAPPPEYGFTAGWHYSGGMVAAVATSCGPGGFDLLDSAGRIRPPRPYPTPPGVSGQEGVVNVYADQVSLLTGNCGNPSRSLYSIDLHTGKAGMLLGQGLNGGSVLSVATVKTW